MRLWIDGELTSEARASLLAHGLHYGTGVFEGIRAYENAEVTAVAVLGDRAFRPGPGAQHLHGSSSPRVRPSGARSPEPGAASSPLPCLEDLHRMRARIAPYLRRTPLLDLEVPTPGGRIPVRAKLELLQVTGCFKVRGALAAMSEAPGSRVVACSGGNHGLGVAHAAKVFRKGATIFVPEGAAALKVASMRALGAEVRHPSTDMGATFRAAEAFALAEGSPLIHPYDQAEVIAGQGTLGLELLEEAPGVDHWMVAVGGGGLAAGLALALEGGARVIPVEPERCRALDAALKSGGPAYVPAGGAARTSLGAPSVGRLPWELLKGRVGPVALVDEEALARAQRWLWQEARLVAEPGGAAALAALLTGAWTPPEGARVGLVICGGNADALP